MITIYITLLAPAQTGAPVLAEALVFQGAPVRYRIFGIAPDPASAPASAG